MKRSHFAVVLLVLAALPCVGRAEDNPVRPIRFMLHGNMTYDLPTEDYLRFVERIKPDILIMGVFDQRLYATAAPAAPKPRTCHHRPATFSPAGKKWPSGSTRMASAWSARWS